MDMPLILVVDDEESVLSLLCRHFERSLSPSEFEYEYIGVQTFDEAEHLLRTRSNDIALAILDQNLRMGEHKSGNQLAACCEAFGIMYGRFIANATAIRGYEGRFVYEKANCEIRQIVYEVMCALRRFGARSHC